LARGDLIYFSDFVENASAPYTTLAAAAGIRALDVAAKRTQEAAICRGFVPCDANHPPRFSRYDIEEFVY